MFLANCLSAWAAVIGGRPAVRSIWPSSESSPRCIHAFPGEYQPQGARASRRDYRPVNTEGWEAVPPVLPTPGNGEERILARPAAGLPGQGWCALPLCGCCISGPIVLGHALRRDHPGAWRQWLHRRLLELQGLPEALGNGAAESCHWGLGGTQWALDFHSGPVGHSRGSMDISHPVQSSRVSRETRPGGNAGGTVPRARSPPRSFMPRTLVGTGRETSDGLAVSGGQEAGSRLHFPRPTWLLVLTFRPGFVEGPPTASRTSLEHSTLAKDRKGRCFT